MNFGLLMASIVCATVAMNAEMLIVKNGDVNISINNNISEMKSGEWKRVEPGEAFQTIEIVSGNGIIEIQDNECEPIRLSMKGARTHKVPEKKGWFSWCNNSLAQVVSLNDKITTGVSKGGNNNNTIDYNITVEENKENIVISSKRWAPFPIALHITRDGKTVADYISNDNGQVEIYFVVKRELLQDGDIYQVITGKGTDYEHPSLSGKFLFSKK